MSGLHRATSDQPVNGTARGREIAVLLIEESSGGGTFDWKPAGFRSNVAIMVALRSVTKGGLLAMVDVCTSV
jgi:hypothetical protein